MTVSIEHKFTVYNSWFDQILIAFQSLVEDLCGSFDRLCSQICENTDDSYVCKCLPYFQLQDDRVTCLPINGTVSTEGNSENEVLPTSSE